MKHRIVYQSLVERIRSGLYQPGIRMPTEIELGKEFNVSRPTVARAMRDLQTEGLVQRRAGDGSYVIDVKSVAADVTLGLIVPELGCGDIFEPICAHLTRAAQSLDMGVIWGNVGLGVTSEASGRLDVSAQVATEAADLLIARKVAGVFFAPLTRGRDDLQVNLSVLEKLRAAGIQVVLLDRDVSLFPARSEYDLVSVDHFLGQYLATQHLLCSGRRRLLYFHWPGESDSVQKRIAGFRACLAAGEVASEKGNPATGSTVSGDPSEDELVRSVMEEHQPEAILCENDLVALRVIQTLHRLGYSTPRELCVFGFNDIAVSQLLRTPLSTISQPCEQIGVAAMEVMQQRLDAPNSPPKLVQLTPKLIARDSTARA